MFEFLNKSTGNKTPTKKNMNLYVQANDTSNPIIAIVTGVVLLAALLVFLKVGIFDRLSKMNALQDEVLSLQSQVDSMNQELIHYDELRDKYRRYTKYYQSGEESGLLSRLDILDLLEENISDIGNIKSIAMNGNSVSITVQVEKLEDFAIIRKRMENNPRVSEITVNQASKGKGDAEIVEGYISFTVIREEEEQ